MCTILFGQKFAKFSTEYVLAQDLKHHTACLILLNNKKISYLRMKQAVTDDTDANGDINEIVLWRECLE